MDEMDIFYSRVADLKKESKYYPHITIRKYTKEKVINKNFCDYFKKDKPKEESGEVYASTLVRIKRNGIWYVVHCAESLSLNAFALTYDEKTLIMLLMEHVYKIQLGYVITGRYEDIDILQISEEERIFNVVKNDNFEKSKYLNK